MAQLQTRIIALALAAFAAHGQTAINSGDAWKKRAPFSISVFPLHRAAVQPEDGTEAWCTATGPQLWPQIITTVTLAVQGADGQTSLINNLNAASIRRGDSRAGYLDCGPNAGEILFPTSDPGRISILAFTIYYWPPTMSR